MKPFSLLPQLFRRYVTSSKIPPILSESLRENFDQISSLGKLPKFPSPQAAEIWNKEIRASLEAAAAAGCAQSVSFLKALEEFRSDPHSVALLLEALPIAGAKDEEFANHLAAIIAGAVGFEPFSDKRVANPFLVKSEDYCGEIPLHVDQPLSFPEIKLFSLTCLSSKSEVKTFLVEVDRIYETLSKEAREVFEKERFACVSIKKDQFLKIFDEGKSGEKLIDFDLDASDFICRNVSGFAPERISSAFAELMQSIAKLCLEGKVDEIKISEGKMLLVKNHRVLHGREAIDISCPSSRVLSRAYFSPKTDAEAPISKADKLLKTPAAQEILE